MELATLAGEVLGRRTLITGAAGSGKTTLLAQLVVQLAGYKLRPRAIAALGVTRGTVAGLAEAIRREYFGDDDQYKADDTGVLIGTIRHAVWRLTGDLDIIRAVKRDARWQYGAFINEYLGMIRTLAGSTDYRYGQRFLRSARRQIVAALRIDADARSAGCDLLMACLENTDPEAPAPAFVLEVAERYAAFKRERSLFDDTDLATAPSWPDEEMQLVLVDDAEDLNRDKVELLARLYPAASFVFAGNPAAVIGAGKDLLINVPHDAVTELPGGRAMPQPELIEDRTGSAAIVPRDVAGDVLIILGDRSGYSLRRWVGWCLAAGLAYRVDDEAVLHKAPALRDVAALWRCDQGDEVHPARLDRLAEALGEPAGINICAYDFRGWSNWRDMARRAYDERTIARAEAMLARYGTLDLSVIARQPMARITSVARCKGYAADSVIIDGFTFAPRPGDSEELIRARWALAMSRARRRLIVLQHETNAKLRMRG